MAFYNPYYQNSYTGQPYNGMQYQQPQQYAQPQQQETRYIPVASKQEMLNYPLAPGNSVTFICEAERSLYVKSRGFSPFDAPRVEDYAIVKKGEMPQPQQGETYALRSELAAVAQKLAELENTIKGGANNEQSV